MIYSSSLSIENLICKHLQRGPLETVLLINRIRKERPSTTKQGVYAQLRKLSKAEVVVTHNKQAALNIRWLKNMDEFFSITQQYYFAGKQQKGNFANLNDGEMITYAFASPTQTDLFWWDALYVLSETAAQNEPAYLYNPHEWFLIARQQSEREAINVITRKRRFLLTAGGKTPLDRAVAKEFDGEMSQYHMLKERLFPKNNYYFNIVGDFLIEVWIDKKIGSQIEEVYERSERLNEEVRNELIRIVQQKGRSKLTISRNKVKAERLKKLLRKNFYLPALTS